MKFLLDAGVPISVGKTLENSGHTVIYYHDALAEKASDILVCETAIRNDAILVAIDRDMKRIAGKSKTENRFDKLNLLHIHCTEVQAAKRLDQSIKLLESEWEFTTQKVARRLWFEVHSHYFKTWR